MNFQMVNRDTNHYILEIREKDEKGQSYLTWDFKKATHFLVVMRALNSDDTYLELGGQFISDLNSKAAGSYASKFQLSDTTSVELIDYKYYMRENRWYYSPIPMKVTVYSCEVVGENCTVYTPENVSSCTIKIPAKLTVTKTKLAEEPQKKGFRLFGKNNNVESPYDKYKVKLSGLNGYSGGIFYQISKNKCLYPVTERMIGKDFIVTVPKGCQISFVLDTKASQNFKLIELS